MKRALILAAVACRAGSSLPPPAKPLSAPQLVTAIVDDWSGTHATLRMWTRDGAGWRPLGEPWPAVIGNAGAAWGDGEHGAGAPAGRGGPIKREGDGKSPAGVFAIRGAYGYAAAAPPGTHLPYTQVDARWQCVDDPHSAHYTQILSRDSLAPDWSSAEQMRRDDDLYAWTIDIAHNPAARPEGGSCIFFHVWSGDDSSTVGCTAMAEPALAHLLATLDPHARYVLLPRAEYTALAPVWGLPAQ